MASFLVDKLRGAARWTWQHADLLLLLFALLLVVTREGPPPGRLSTGVRGMVRDVRFDFWRWETDALWSKFTHWLVQPQRYMDESDRVQIARGFVGLVGRVNRLEYEIEMIYTDPEVADPAAEAADLRDELAQMRRWVRIFQLLAESILEEQVAVVLHDEGLSVFGQPFPPVGIHFTPLPTMLIISPRERIERLFSADLAPGMDAARRAEIEQLVDERYDVSSLVTNIGGLAAWPAMVLETSSLPWIMDTTAHEWTHHYLHLRPLGWEYTDNPEARIINETTASIVGEEVGLGVLVRYYPDLLPPPPADPAPDGPPPDPPAFDFRAEMYETRVQVDLLLAEGRVEEAEEYMEQRRTFFWENGYRIRKLNQAYFAFHGAYAHAPGAAGEDPIGPAVQELWRRSDGLAAFLRRVAFITTLQDLQAELESP